MNEKTKQKNCTNVIRFPDQYKKAQKQSDEMIHHTFSTMENMHNLASHGWIVEEELSRKESVWGQILTDYQTIWQDGRPDS